MNNKTASLASLGKKYQEEVEYLETKLSEAKRKLSAILEVSDLLDKEDTSSQSDLFPNQKSSIYEKMRMGDAILDIVTRGQGKKLSSAAILDSLKINGFSSGSKDLKRDLYTRLHRLEKSGKLSSRKEGGFKKYYIKEVKTEDQPKGE